MHNHGKINATLADIDDIILFALSIKTLRLQITGPFGLFAHIIVSQISCRLRMRVRSTVVNQLISLVGSQIAVIRRGWWAARPWVDLVRPRWTLKRIDYL